MRRRGHPSFSYRFQIRCLAVVLQELVGISASELRLNTSVTRVVGSAKDGYSLFGGGDEEKLGTFDAVVIAAPIGLAGIALDMRGEVTKAMKRLVFFSLKGAELGLFFILQFFCFGHLILPDLQKLAKLTWVGSRWRNRDSAAIVGTLGSRCTLEELCKATCSPSPIIVRSRPCSWSRHRR